MDEGGEETLEEGSLVAVDFDFPVHCGQERALLLWPLVALHAILVEYGIGVLGGLRACVLDSVLIV